MAGRLSPLQVTLRKDRVEVESLGGYRQLRLEPVFLGVGSWTVIIPVAHAAAQLLLQAYDAGDDLASWGIVTRHPGTPDVILSGPAMDAYLVETATGAQLTLVGLCDNAIINGEVGSPAPTVDVPADTLGTLPTARDVFTGPAEDALLHYLGANIGPAAGVARRRYPWLNLPTSQGRGASGKWEPRFENLTTLAESICTWGGLGYRAVQGAPGVTDVQVWEPVLHPEARFSVQAKNLERAELVWRAANTTEVIEASDQEEADRNFYRRTAPGTYAFRRVSYMDKRNTTDLPKLQQDADEELTKGAVTAGIRLIPVDMPGLRLGVDYQLGGKVIGVVGGHDITETVRRAVITHDAGDGDSPAQPVQYQVQIGVPDAPETPDLEPVVRRLAADVSTLTRR